MKMADYMLTSNQNLIYRRTDSSFIPIDSREWNDYQTWLASGNVSDPYVVQAWDSNGNLID